MTDIVAPGDLITDDAGAGPRQRVLVADEGGLGLRIAELLDDRLHHPELRLCADEAELEAVVEQEGPFDLLVAGPALCTTAGAGTLSELRRLWPRTTLLLVAGRTQLSARNLVRTGAIDVLRATASDAELQAALEDALGVARALASGDGGPDERPAGAGGRARRKLGQVITVSSATGGCGKTFFSTNLALYLKRATGGRVCIVDLDLQFGEVSTALRLRPKFTIFDLLRRADTVLDDLTEHIEEYVVDHESGISVLAAPKDPAEADDIQPPQVTAVISALRSRFDHVIVDTPGQLNEIVLAAFDQSERLVVMATLDLPSVRNTSLFLSTLDKLRIPSDSVRLVLNKEETDVGIDTREVEKLFAQGFMCVLPYAKEVSRSINLGMPVIAAAPKAPISQRMTQGMTGLLPDGVAAPDGDGTAADPATNGTPARRGLFARLTKPLLKTA